jgi:hypothetical protein
VVVDITVMLAKQHASFAVGVPNVHGEPGATEKLGGQLIVGGIVSVMVTVCEQMTVLPQQSLMSHWRVVVCVQGVPKGGLVNCTVIVTFVPQHASNAVGASNVHAVPHWTVLFGAQATTGGAVSVTITVWLQVAVLPQQSTACQLRVWVRVQPTMFVVVLVIVTVTFVPQQRSEAVGGVNVHGVPQLKLRLLAQVSTGGVVSVMVTTFVQIAMFVQQSIACHVIVRISLHGPTMFVLAVRIETVGVGQQRSVAVGKINGLPHCNV